MSTSGRFLRAQVNGVPVRGVRDWNATPDGDPKLDASDADSAPYTDSDAGLYGVQLAISGIWDPALDGPFPGFLQGAILTNVYAYSNRTNATPDYNLPLAIVTEDGQAAEVRGQITYNFTICNKGQYFRHGLLAAVS